MINRPVGKKMLKRSIAIILCTLILLGQPSLEKNLALAASKQPCPEQSHAAMTHFLANVITWLNTLQTSTGQQDLELVKQYFTPELTIHHNGRLIASGYSGFYKSQLLSRRFITRVDTHLPLKEILADGQKAAFHTTTTLTKKNHPPEEHEIIALIEFSKCKISHWREVSKKIR